MVETVRVGVLRDPELTAVVALIVPAWTVAVETVVRAFTEARLATPPAPA
jgi:hypothetical protein